MDPQHDQNKPKQCNPKHQPTGPGHQRGYQGYGDKADKDNHGNQLNPNNERYVPKK